MNEEEMKIEEEVKKVIISTPSNNSESIYSGRRNSTGKVSIKKTPSFSIKEKKVEPRYLRSSTSSCHDVCKHGKTHLFEVHQKRLPARRFSMINNNKKSTEPKDSVKFRRFSQTNDKEIEQNGLPDFPKFLASEKESIESSSPKEKIMICHEVVPPLDLPENISVESVNSHEVAAPHDIPDNISVETVICHEVITVGSESLDMKKTPNICMPEKDVNMSYDEALNVKTASVISEAETIKSTSRSPISKAEEKVPKKFVKKSNAVEEKKRGLRSSVLRKELKVGFIGKSSTSIDTRTPLLSDTNKSRILERKSASSSSIMKPTISISPEGISKKTTTPKFTNKKLISSTIKKPNVLVSSNVTNVKTASPVKRPAPTKPKISLIKSTSALVPSRRSTTQNNTGKKLVKSINSALKSSVFSKPKVQAKGGEKEKEDEKVDEKILYVTEPRTPNQPIKKNQTYTPSHSRKSSISSEKKNLTYTPSHSRKSSISSEKKNQTYTPSHSRRSSMSSEKKKKLVKNPTSNQESKLATPHKLAFQRGKIVNPNSENNGSRKLKFRQGKSLNESPKSRETKRLKFRTRRTSFGSSKELKNSKLKAPDVVLRHQDVKEEKKAQDLLNVVIEETASKLVETRKSKVKALVGAFETVISLHEKRAAPTPSA